MGFWKIQDGGYGGFCKKVLKRQRRFGSSLKCQTTCRVGVGWVSVWTKVVEVVGCVWEIGGWGDHLFGCGQAKMAAMGRRKEEGFVVNRHFMMLT